MRAAAHSQPAPIEENCAEAGERARLAFIPVVAFASPARAVVVVGPFSDESEIVVSASGQILPCIAASVPVVESVDVINIAVKNGEKAIPVHFKPLPHLIQAMS